VEGGGDAGGWYVIDCNTRKPVAGPFSTRAQAEDHHRTVLLGEDSYEVVREPLP
jgi:hypothetical protein